MTTVSSSTSVGLDLDPPGVTSPVVIAPGVTVTNPSYPFAVYTHSGGTTFFTVENQGVIGAASSAGIYLAPGGAIINDAGALITGTDGIRIAGGAGTISNAGTISQASSLSGTAISLAAGGTIGNATSGRIAGYVRVSGAAGTVTNDGTMTGATLSAGGQVTNGASGLIAGGATGLDLRGGAATLVNAGSVAGLNAVIFGAADAVVVNSGTIAGTSVNSRGILMSASGTVTNLGMITGSFGISIAGAGLVSNLVGGTISAMSGYSGSWAVRIEGAGTVTNAAGGLIAGNLAVSLASHGAILANDGTIDGYVSMRSGTLTNAASGVMTGGSDYVAVNAAKVTNAGTILGGSSNGFNGVALTGESVANLAGAVVYSFGTGLHLSGSLSNAGRIIGLQHGVYAGGVMTNLSGGSIEGGIKSAFSLSVTNSGSIDGNNPQNLNIPPRPGLALFSGGAVSNLAGGTIIGDSHVGAAGVAGRYGIDVNNLGLIQGRSGAGVAVSSGTTLDVNTILNGAGAIILGTAGVTAGIGLTTVSNAGTIQGSTGAGIDISSTVYSVNNGMVTNQAGAMISGQTYGVRLIGTLANAGTIIGNAGTAVAFAGTASNRLILTPGFAFTGVVSGGTSASNTLELASAASSGTLAGLGITFTHFDSIVFDAGADWFIAGLPRGLSGSIAGFDPGDTIELTGITATGSSYAGGVLTIERAGSPITLDLPGSFGIDDFRVVNVAGGVDVSLACFAEGTAIRMPWGDVAVEALRIGDVVLCADGTEAPVVWLGHRRVDCRRHARPQDVLPVRVRAGAFGAGRPARDLVLSPDHAVFHDGVLIPVRYLLNGSTVVQERVDFVTYWHVELPGHGVLLAEGLPCESYLDTGNRAAFVEGGAVPQLHPDFARSVWAADACAELVFAGARLAAAKRHLIREALAGGWRITADPGLRLLADGQPIPAEFDGMHGHATLPPGAQMLRLVSRCWVPAHMAAEQDDTRCLGIAIAELRLEGRPVPLDHPALLSGWHAPEPGWRWTDGDAGLAVLGARTVSFACPVRGSYWDRRASRANPVASRPILPGPARDAVLGGTAARF